MDKIFLSVLHEEEKLDEVSLDALKGGFCGFFKCPCNDGGNLTIQN